MDEVVVTHGKLSSSLGEPRDHDLAAHEMRPGRDTVRRIQMNYRSGGIGIVGVIVIVLVVLFLLGRL